MELTATTLDDIRVAATRQLDQSKRGALGQFMTPSQIATFMAGLFTYGKSASLLDAGAGIGSLTSAFLDQAIMHGTKVSVETWEIDPTLQRYLAETLASYEARGLGSIETKINGSDFIEEASFIVSMELPKRYTHAILNPPYKKLNSNSKHRHLLRTVGIETCNLYTAFVALAVLQMQKGGEVVAIIPRSFCNGTYYRPFRELILGSCAIRQIHLFESRSKAFGDDEVLQENVIIHLVKGEPQGRVIVSTSHDARFTDLERVEFDPSAIVKPGDPECFIHVPTEEDDTKAPTLCTHTLKELGLEVCTGPVVDFRLKEFWSKDPAENTVPTLYPHHFTEGVFTWPKVHKKPNALLRAPEVEKGLMPRGAYVLVKRFSAKEERRRVVAHHLRAGALDSDKIGFENHWNVFHVGKRGLDADLASGLAVFLNSTVLDAHFRVFSGHTQVNATDLRSMKYPSHSQLVALGKMAKGQPTDQATIDRLLEQLQEE